MNSSILRQPILACLLAGLLMGAVRPTGNFAHNAALPQAEAPAFRANSPASPARDATPFQVSAGWPEVEPVASYGIMAELDPQQHRLTASQTITYTNTTTAPFIDLVFHLYLNAFRSPDSLFLSESGLQHRGHLWDADHPGWIEVTALRLRDGPALDLESLEDGTLARADLPTPVDPGESVVVEVEFQAQLPRVFARTGWATDQAGDPFYMVGQWFPKLGVWTERGWNAYPFHANAEFFADFGAYDVHLSLPAAYQTGGTGLLVSREEHPDGTQTVHYHAQGVIDFAWTASPNFEPHVRQVGGVEIVYLALPEHRWTAAGALDVAEETLLRFGEWFGAYPYPRLTIVDVPASGTAAGGMEYPTLVTAGVESALLLSEDIVRLGVDRTWQHVIVHEIGHQWWQSVVAFNEAEEPWLDEGLTEYSAIRLMNEVIDPQQQALDLGGLETGFLQLRRMEYVSLPHTPMAGAAWEFGQLDYSVGAYSKPALSLLTLEGVLGPEQMLSAMRTFFERYRFAHPTAEDLRRTVEEVSGQDLSWFFDDLVAGEGVVNYRMEALDGEGFTAVREGSVAVPTEVLVTFADGEQLIEPWDGEATPFTRAYPDRPPLVSAVIDPDQKLLIDLVWADNGLLLQEDTNSWLGTFIRLVYWLQNLFLGLGGL